jgi:hypothetical protein
MYHLDIDRLVNDLQKFTPQSSVSTVGGGQEQSRWDLDMQRLLKHFELCDNCEWHDHPGLPVCKH